MFRNLTTLHRMITFIVLLVGGSLIFTQDLNHLLQPGQASTGLGHLSSFLLSSWFKGMLTGMCLSTICVMVVVNLKTQKQKNLYKGSLDHLFAHYQISQRERDIISLWVKGKTRSEIGDELFISPHTVKNHLYRIYKKLNITSRHELKAAIEGIQQTTSV